MAPQAEPLAGEQRDMAMIGATPQGSYREQAGSPDVLVGIIDTGVDASHPDIAPNFVGSLSRNFTENKEDIDGPCAEEPDQSCTDPANVDEGGHGTHVAGTVGAALNGVGIGGVAPETGIVNLRAGQDSGIRGSTTAPACRRTPRPRGPSSGRSSRPRSARCGMRTSAA